MSDSLYQDKILNLAKDKTHTTSLELFDRCITLDNPLCGDRLTLKVRFKDDTIEAVSHDVRGCALCKASTAYLAQNVTGLIQEKIRIFHDTFEQFLISNQKQPLQFQTLDIFNPVRQHKSRHNCVLLPFKAILKAFESCI